MAEYQQDVVTFLEDARVKASLVTGFESATLKFKGSGTGSDWTLERSTSKALSGDASLHLVTKTTTPAAGDSIGANAYAPFTDLPNHMRISCGFTLDEDTAEVNIIFRFDVYDSLNDRYPIFKVRWSGADARWEYVDSAGVYIDLGIANISMNTVYDQWNYITLEGLPLSAEYLKVRINDQEVDMAGIAAQIFTPAGTDRNAILCQLTLSTIDAVQREIYIDDFALTAV